MKALVIGATGYVGSAVARNFKAHGYKVHGLARNAGNSGWEPEHLDLIDDIRNGSYRERYQRNQPPEPDLPA